MDDRDGRHYFYDINALSNFVADAQNVVGFDPFERFVDYLEVRAGFAHGSVRHGNVADARGARAATRPIKAGAA